MFYCMFNFTCDRSFTQLVTSSALRSRNWQLIGMISQQSLWPHRK